MIQTDSAWHDKRETKIGDYGEALVQQYLEEHGCICYKSVTPKAHPLDYLVVWPDKTINGVEVKTKPSRDKYPDTGFNLKHYYGYKQFTDALKISMRIYFVDSKCGRIYGNYLCELDKPRMSEGRSYPREESSWNGQLIRYYPLDVMIPIRDLTNEEICVLNRLRSEKN